LFSAIADNLAVAADKILPESGVRHVSVKTESAMAGRFP
jgi:hypothetical protein